MHKQNDASKEAKHLNAYACSSPDPSRALLWRMLLGPDPSPRALHQLTYTQSLHRHLITIKREAIRILSCLMTPGLSEDIQCYAWPRSFFKCLHITKSDITPPIQWACQLGDCSWSQSSSGIGVGEKWSENKLKCSNNTCYSYHHIFHLPRASITARKFATHGIMD